MIEATDQIKDNSALVPDGTPAVVFKKTKMTIIKPMM